MKKQVKDLQVGNKFIRPDIPYILNNRYITDKVYWIANVFCDSYLIDNGVSLFELNGNRSVELV